MKFVGDIYFESHINNDTISKLYYICLITYLCNNSEYCVHFNILNGFFAFFSRNKYVMLKKRLNFAQNFRILLIFI